jgi:hypothetical protein
VPTQDNRSIVERYAQALPSDYASLAGLRHPDFVEDWPQSGERIRGHANYQAIHENYPGGLPDLKPRRILGSEISGSSRRASRRFASSGGATST